MYKDKGRRAQRDAAVNRTFVRRQKASIGELDLESLARELGEKR